MESERRRARETLPPSHEIRAISKIEKFGTKRKQGGECVMEVKDKGDSEECKN